jgi:hypothetical protein
MGSIEERLGAMRRRDRIFIVGLLVALFVAQGLPAANAYVDPGAGSFLFQAAVGGLLAIGLALKVFWRRIVGLFTGRRSAPSTAEADAHATAPPPEA